MSHHGAIEQLLGEVAAILGTAGPAAVEGEPAWTLRMDAESAFHFEHEVSAARLMVSCAIAEVPQPARLRIYELLLQFNLLWTDTGGMRMALCAAPGPAVLMLDLPAHGLDPARLCSVLSEMGHVVQTWRETLRAAGERDRENHDAPGLQLPPAA